MFRFIKAAWTAATTKVAAFSTAVFASLFASTAFAQDPVTDAISDITSAGGDAQSVAFAVLGVVVLIATVLWIRRAIR